jgi:hypothetical protein
MQLAQRNTLEFQRLRFSGTELMDTFRLLQLPDVITWTTLIARREEPFQYETATMPQTRKHKKLSESPKRLLCWLTADRSRHK